MEPGFKLVFAIVTGVTVAIGTTVLAEWLINKPVRGR